MTTTLNFVWTVSRARDTYGYNICSLWVRGEKVASCNGGGYDMKGTSLGLWIERAYRDRLVKATIPADGFYGLTYHDPNFNPGKAKALSGKTVEEAEAAGETIGLERYQAIYSASSKVPTERHTVPRIDGAYGFSSVEQVMKAIGLTLEYVPTRKRDDSTYILHDAAAEAA